MNESLSLTNNLLMEVEALSNRLRNIKRSFNKNIFKRVKEIYKIAELLSNKSNGKINFSNLLLEITRRTLNENKFESNLFFL